MKKIIKITIGILLFNSITFAQVINIHTQNGTDSYNLADIDSITFDVSSAIPQDGLIGYYPFNGNSNDESGNGEDASNDGAVLTEDKSGNPESAYYFNGSARMSLDPTGMPQTSADAFSISVWIKPDSIIQSKWLTLIYWGNNPETNGIVSLGYKMIAENNFYINLSFYANDLTYNNNESNIINSWNHIAVTYDGVNRKLYLNGNLVAEDSTSALNISQLKDFYFGYREDYFQGALDEIRIYDRALKPEEIKTLYTAY